MFSHQVLYYRQHFYCRAGETNQESFRKISLMTDDELITAARLKFSNVCRYPIYNVFIRILSLYITYDNLTYRKLFTKENSL